MGTVSNIKVQPCRASWGGSDLGFTDGDIAVKVDEKVVDITAHQEGSNVLDAIRTGKSVEIDLTLKETSLAKLQTILAVGGGNQGGVAQIATILCIADVSGSLNNRFFFITGKNPTTKALVPYCVWFNVNGAGTDPSIPGYTSIPVAIATSDTANTVADLVAAALDATAEFAAPNPGAATITCTWSEAGLVDAMDAGNSGFTLTVTTPGTSSLYGWGNSKDFSALSDQADQLILHPVALADDVVTSDLNFWLAYPMLDQIEISGEKPQTFKVKFKIFPDTSKADEIRLFAVGDGA